MSLLSNVDYEVIVILIGLLEYNFIGGLFGCMGTSESHFYINIILIILHDVFGPP